MMRGIKAVCCFILSAFQRNFAARHHSRKRNVGEPWHGLVRLNADCWGRKTAWVNQAGVELRQQPRRCPSTPGLGQFPAEVERLYRSLVSDHSVHYHFAETQAGQIEGRRKGDDQLEAEAAARL